MRRLSDHETLALEYATTDTVPDGWHQQAECKGMGHHVFYPEVKRGGHTEALYVEAKPICEACPVQAECLADALLEEARRPQRMNDECHGYRGGATPTRRRRLAESAGLGAIKKQIFMRRRYREDGGWVHAAAQSYDERILYGYEATLNLPIKKDSPWEVDYHKRQRRKVS